MSRLRLVSNSDPVLREKSLQVAFPLSKEVRDLVGQMIFACKKFKGIGLAAPQIGKSLRIAIINLEPFKVPAFPIFNPVLIKESGKSSMEEGCLSIPNQFGQVSRPEKISVEFWNLDGKKVKLDLDELSAKVFQHEIDHLNGILISDKWDEKSVHTVTEEWKRKNRKARARRYKQ